MVFGLSFYPMIPQYASSALQLRPRHLSRRQTTSPYLSGYVQIACRLVNPRPEKREKVDNIFQTPLSLTAVCIAGELGVKRRICQDEIWTEPQNPLLLQARSWLVWAFQFQQIHSYSNTPELRSVPCDEAS